MVIEGNLRTVCIDDVMEVVNFNGINSTYIICIVFVIRMTGNQQQYRERDSSSCFLLRLRVTAAVNELL